MLIVFAGTWKKRIVTSDIELVEGDIPFNENLHGLKDYVPEPVDNKPDGTIEYYDENGNKKEKWLPPKQLKELLKKGGTKRLYKVLVKGPWNGIKETLWELSDDTVEKFVDEKDYAYAVCAYEKGEPRYTLTKKKIWDNMEEVGKILMNPNLSEEQRMEEIKKLAED